MSLYRYLIRLPKGKKALFGSLQSDSVNANVDNLVKVLTHSFDLIRTNGRCPWVPSSKDVTIRLFLQAIPTEVDDSYHPLHIGLMQVK